MSNAATDIEERRAHVVSICAAMPEVHVRDEQHIAFAVRKKNFAYYLDDHHGDGRVAINCKAPAGAQGELCAAEPERYYVPKYLGHRGWVGLFLDSDDVDWDEVEDLLRDAYRMTAPKRLAAQV
ncbi:MAG: MmcQ/YjbR family DNA-binding protein [Dehalococcoidia bacterium]|nr:MmcQ/YjbR family DNA-binding protein [Dehalococcoidia bacterium]